MSARAGFDPARFVATIESLDGKVLVSIIDGKPRGIYRGEPQRQHTKAEQDEWLKAMTEYHRRDSNRDAIVEYCVRTGRTF